MPCTDYIDSRHYESAMRFALRSGGLAAMDILVNSGALIYVSRDYIARTAIETGADYVLWFDSDVTFEPDILKRLLDDSKDFVTGLYFRRRPPFNPVIYKTIRYGEGDEAISEPYEDYPEEDIFEIDACGLGGCLTKVSMLEDVARNYGTLFTPFRGYGEDISFAIRAKNLGYQIWCDSRIKMGHVAFNISNESTWKQVKGKINVS